ncbi:alpha/beta hydrolase [Bowmanella sp. Y26]|uniref:alpha/beta fold hydrolase n=1 Tax=Bowmanella yangjiangensis TaxID=2811230 RepID=UPI001BDBF26D|nr:alpha/beta hydrolase [Bowmanella yangjiangensis]MBT1065513.1 alpha/beta hydrolase [Bowmanella yangjiangensis]
MNKVQDIKGDYLTVDGSQIYYELRGYPQDKTLVILHGGLGSSRDMACLQAYIPAGYQCVAMDFRGHGRSSLGSQPLTYARYQQDVETLLAHLGIQQYSLLGFSDGGIVAYRLAAASPQKVQRLIAIGAQWRLLPDDPSIELLQGLTPDFWCVHFSEDVAWYYSANPEPDFELLVDKLKSLWLDTTESGYPNQQVTKIVCPVLQLRGDKDFLLSLNEARLLGEQLGQSDFMNVPFASHSVHQEAEDLVGAVVRRFLV